MTKFGQAMAGEPDSPPDPKRPCGDTGLSETVSATLRHEAARWTWCDWRRYLVRGRRPDPVPSFTGSVEDPEVGKVGIACSGGGIRSAAFNLGALQVLQSKGKLAESKYLAGVSGGSYIAAAFCMVRKTWAPGSSAAEVEKSDDSDPALVAKAPPFAPGSPEEQYLRNRSSYMASNLQGKAELGYRFILGLAFNLLVISLFILAIAALLAVLFGWLYPNLDQTISACGSSCHFSASPRESVWIPIVGAAAVGLLGGVLSMIAFRWPGCLRDFVSTLSIRLLTLAGAAALVLIVLPLLLAWVRHLGVPGESELPVVAAKAPDLGPTAAIIGAGGLSSTVAAVLLFLRAEWKDVTKIGAQAKAVGKWYSGLGKRLQRLLAEAIAAIAGPLFALAMLVFGMSALLNLVHPWELWARFGVVTIPLVVLYLFADLTSWSLHLFYRRRLASAFALKRVSSPEGCSRPAEYPAISKPEVGIAVERDYDRLLTFSSAAIERNKSGECQWPTLLVCAAANVSDDAATPPGRGVTSFTFSSGSIGGPLVGAVETAKLEESLGHDTYRLSRFSVMAAVAMSGAALSPSMGKQTRRPLRLLLGLANVRLGVWVPNPRRMETFEKRQVAYPRPRPWYLLRELFGVNSINAPFLYVTDGGHYENLGVLELLRRGCTEVYCFDASNDKLDALGDLVSLARSELEVKIDINPAKLVPKEGVSESHCVEGTITYPGDAGLVGRLYYTRPVVTKEPSADVAAYSAVDANFPHDSTINQLYSDQRFEAYRALGIQAATQAVEESARPAPTPKPTPTPATAPPTAAPRAERKPLGYPGRSP